MQSFKDTLGRTWDLRITTLTAKKIRARTGFNATTLLTKDTLMKLHDDDELVLELLWAVVEQQAEKRDIDFNTFFGGDPDKGLEPCVDSDVLEIAFDRLCDAVIEYLPEKKRAAGKKVLTTLRTAGERAIATGTNLINQTDPEEIAAEVEQAVRSLSTSGDGSTSSPGSSA